MAATKTVDSINFDYLFDFDQKTKDTIKHSMIGLVIVEMIFLLEALIFYDIGFYTLSRSVATIIVGGIVSGWALSKFYDFIASWVAAKARFLLPLTKTFFRFLFAPIVVYAVVATLFTVVFGGLLTAIGAGLGSMLGGSAGGLLGGAFGLSFILLMLVGIAIEVVARFIYAKYMVTKVGKYYKDYS